VSDEDKGMASRATDNPEIKPVRFYPNYAVVATVISTIAGWLFIAGMQWNGYQQQRVALSELTGAVKTLVAQVAAKDIKDAQHDARLDEHDRRLTEFGARISNLESRR
jgi:hypothetical protein